MSWEIIDDNGVLFSGSEDEMIHAFDVMTDPNEHSNDDNDNYPSQWEGDLKLIHVVNICR
jgi:hypothetical protein